MLVEQLHAPRTEFRSSLRRLAPAALLMLLCLPALLFVWHNRDVPHFGILQDDGVYLIDAQALAKGEGYRILSLPGQPFDTRYPPLYPLYLSLAWRAAPTFPENLSIAIMLSWLSFPVVVMFTYLLFRHQGYRHQEYRHNTLPASLTWLVVGLFALNPYVLFFVSNLGSELLFMAFLLGAIFVAERTDHGAWWGPAVAGALAGAAYLTRTSGIALLPAAIAYYAWRKRPGAAIWFSLGMLPAIIGWMLWSRVHAAPGRDIVTLCYTNYLGYYFMNVGWDNLVHVIGRNLSALLETMGSLIFPQAMDEGVLAKLILWPLAIAMILGCVRMVRQGIGRLYALFGGLSLAMLLVWHYKPNQRFILPLAPLLLAGFCYEMTYLGGRFSQAIAGRTRFRRLAAYGCAGSLIIVLTLGLVLQLSMDIGVIPKTFADDRANSLAYRNLYRWIAGNLPADANILWQDDTALYLVTSRRSVSFVIPPREFEATGGEPGEAARYRKIVGYARQEHMSYLLLAKIGPRYNKQVLSEATLNRDLEQVHEEAGGVLYRIR